MLDDLMLHYFNDGLIIAALLMLHYLILYYLLLRHLMLHYVSAPLFDVTLWRESIIKKLSKTKLFHYMVNFN